MRQLFLPALYTMMVFPLFGFAPQTEKDSAACVPIRRDSWMAKDKARHFTASALMAGGLSWHRKHKTQSDSEQAKHFGIGITFSLGFAKELADTRKAGGFFSWKDLTADVLGIAAGMLVLGRW